jgi:hypothetical protein
MRLRLRVVRAAVLAHLLLALTVPFVWSLLLPPLTLALPASAPSQAYALTSAFGQYPLLTHLPLPPAPLASSATSNGGPTRCTNHFRAPECAYPFVEARRCTEEGVMVDG